jgi:hypothetical protein
MAKQGIGIDESFLASANQSSSQYYFVKMSGTADYVAVVNGATNVPLGIQQDRVAAVGRDTLVRLLGWSKVVAGESISVGDQIGSGADGKATVLVPGTNTQNYIAGIAMGTASTDGDIAEVFLFGPKRAR